jgi:hypothetical protein
MIDWLSYLLRILNYRELVRRIKAYWKVIKSGRQRIGELLISLK